MGRRAHGGIGARGGISDPREFVSKAEEFLSKIGVEEILKVSFGGDEIYRRDEKGHAEAASLSDVVACTLTQLVNSQRRIDHIMLVAHGKTDEFELQLTPEFKSTHPPAISAISLEVWSLPSELWRKDGESEFEFADRVNNLILNEEYAQRLGSESRAKMEKLLEDYGSDLRQRFEVRDMTHELKVDISSIFV
jgi:hypothetical protein